MMDKLIISFLEKPDFRDAIRVLSIAMENNPMNVAVFQSGPKSVREYLEIDFFGSFSELPGIVFTGKVEGQIVGVMRMRSCDGSKDPDKQSNTDEPRDIGRRKSIWLNDWVNHDPPDPHWHLGPIGVLQSYQGKGIGTKLLHRFCQEVDTCLAPAYLETDVVQLVPYYERFGFELVAESNILGVKSSFMWRSPLREGELP
jgi:ribosomal protein S18 acetylase RimI-like enzyme